MEKKEQSCRDRIVEEANHLFYTKGYNQTSFADIASAVSITKGNLHYHFRSKKDLFDTIIAYRIASISEQLVKWDEQFTDPLDRLKRFVQILSNEKANLVRYGCPLGSLNMELGKCQQSLQIKSREMFELFQHWLEKNFKQLGKKNSKSLSYHLLAMAQGAALMAYVYTDEKMLKSECKNINDWLDSL